MKIKVTVIQIQEAITNAASPVKKLLKNEMLITKAIHTFRKLFRSLLQQVKKHCFVFFMLVCNENVKTFIRFE